MKKEQDVKEQEVVVGSAEEPAGAIDDLSGIKHLRVYEWCPCGSGKKARKCCLRPTRGVRLIRKKYKPKANSKEGASSDGK